ncbi:MAG: hypothetical protein QOF51_3876 [Chloroflexota bacterium]|nr:hypothetical protein [Chloroflexota bacterium]
MQTSTVPDGWLAGRSAELATLTQYFATASEGHTVTVLMTGEPGGGKTHLLRAFANWAAQRGATVLSGGASDAELMPPYLPFIEALDPYMRDTPRDLLHEQLGPLAPLLATILPELTPLVDATQPTYMLPPEQARLRLYQAVSDLIAHVAASAPVVLLLDDLQWADPASLDLLCYLVQHRPQARLLILGAYREGDVGSQAPLERALAALSRLRVLHTVTLAPLSAEEIGELAQHALGSPIEMAARSLLFERSEGNAFFAEELLRDWLESGVMTRDGPAWRLATPAVDVLPTTVIRAVRERLVGLTLETVRALQTAAVIGRTFDLELLAEALGSSLELTEDCLLEAVRARLLRQGAAMEFTFGHDLIRECLYDQVTAVRRQRLHGFIGRALEARVAITDAQPDSHRLATLAFHFARSGDRLRGATYARQAADRALRTYAPDSAVAQYRAALELTDSADPQRGELLLGLGEASQLAGDERGAADAFGMARRWFEAAGDRMAAGHAAHRLGQSLWRQEEIAAARTAFETGQTALGDHTSPELARTLLDLGSLRAVSQHELAEGMELCRRAVALAQELDDPRLLTASRRALGNLLVRSNQLSDGIPMLYGALAAAADDPVEAAECCGCLAPALFWQGHINEAREVVHQRAAFAARCQDPYELRHVDAWLALFHGLRGEWAAAAQAIEHAQAIVDRLSSPEPQAYVQFLRGGLAYFQGECAAAEHWLTPAIATFRAIGPGALIWYLGLLGMTQLKLGNVAEARAVMDELETLLGGVPVGTMPTSEPLSYLAELALALDDHDRINALREKLRAFAGQFHDLVVDRLLGEIEVRRRDWRAAATHLDAAEALTRREELPSELARTLEAQAALALAHGGRSEPGHVRRLLEESRALYQRLGREPDARRVSERLGMASSPRAKPAPLPAGLSAREVDVLRLVATGCSNREIAQRLVLSEKTVERHLTRIYGKTSADNRAAAAAFAIRHGLA